MLFFFTRNRLYIFHSSDKLLQHDVSGITDWSSAEPKATRVTYFLDCKSNIRDLAPVLYKQMFSVTVTPKYTPT